MAVSSVGNARAHSGSNSDRDGGNAGIVINSSNNTGIVGYGSNPAIMIGNNGYSGGGLGYGSSSGAFSSSAAAGDIVLRTNTGRNLVLQSGGGNAGIVINSSNNTLVYNNLNVSGTIILTGATQQLVIQLEIFLTF